MAVAVSCVSGPAGAQPVVGTEQEIDFERPESWAMQYFGSVTLLTAMGRPMARPAGQVELAFELGWIPELTEEQQRVGFNGTKFEDLNRTPVSPRPHVLVGIGWNTTLDVTYVPPIEIAGLEPNLLAIGLERPVLDRETWSVGLRIAGQVGEIEGDYTCTEDDASFPPGSEQNPFGCEAPSSDTANIDYLMVGLTGGSEIGTRGRWAVHGGLYATRWDLEFQVDARRFGTIDRNRLITDGWTWAVAGGATVRVGERTRLATELFYTPLDVRRTPSAPTTENDPLFNVRLMMAYVWN
jgi:hypothetical protein